MVQHVSELLSFLWPRPYSIVWIYPHFVAPIHSVMNTFSTLGTVTMNNAALNDACASSICLLGVGL